MAWTSFDSPAGLFTLSNTGGANNETKIHPTQKPVKLYKWCLTRYAKKGDKILDTHAGSGSLRIAAYELGFDYTGYEISETYLKDSIRRFNLLKSQTTLF